MDPPLYHMEPNSVRHIAGAQWIFGYGIDGEPIQKGLAQSVWTFSHFTYVFKLSLLCVYFSLLMVLPFQIGMFSSWK